MDIFQSLFFSISFISNYSNFNASSRFTHINIFRFLVDYAYINDDINTRILLYMNKSINMYYNWIIFWFLKKKNLYPSSKCVGRFIDHWNVFLVKPTFLCVFFIINSIQIWWLLCPIINIYLFLPEKIER